MSNAGALKIAEARSESLGAGSRGIAGDDPSSSSSSSAVEAVDRAGDVGVLDPGLESPRPSCAGAAGGRGIVDVAEDDVVAKFYTTGEKRGRKKRISYSALLKHMAVLPHRKRAPAKGVGLEMLLTR